MRQLVLALAFLLGTGACTASADGSATTIPDVPAEDLTGAVTQPPPAQGSAGSSAVPATTVTSGSEPLEAPIPLPAGLALTPPQAEGPYYPVALPDDTDNDLTTIFDGPRAVGTVLDLRGLVVTSDGEPLTGAIVEIWQTDAGGVYLHPDDPRFAQRDPNFQAFGEFETDAAGGYAFTTVVPGTYERRPAHIHVKVFYDDREILTSQIYFNGAGVDPIAPAGEAGSLTAELVAGDAGLEAVHIIVVDV